MWVRGAVVDEEDRLSKRDAGRLVRRALAMCRPFMNEIVFGLSLMVIGVACQVAGPFLFAYAIDRGIRHHDGGALDLAALLLVATALTNQGCHRAYLVI